MATHSETVYTALCDIDDCEEIYGCEDDWSAGWWEYPSDAEDEAERGTWTRVDGMLICDSNDEEHQAARHQEPDPRPTPGPGQLALIPHRTSPRWIAT